MQPMSVEASTLSQLASASTRLLQQVPPLKATIQSPPPPPPPPPPLFLLSSSSLPTHLILLSSSSSYPSHPLTSLTLPPPIPRQTAKSLARNFGPASTPTTAFHCPSTHLVRQRAGSTCPPRTAPPPQPTCPLPASLTGLAYPSLDSVSACLLPAVPCHQTG
jgi:hypothetical protein